MQGFSEVLKLAKEQLTYTADEPSMKADVIYDLAKYKDSQRQEIIEFVKNGFKILRQEAKRREQRGDSDLINDVMFGALAWLAGMIEEKSLAPIIYKEFLFAIDSEQHYGMNQTAGVLAIVLSLLGHHESLHGFRKFLHSFEWRYPGEIFVLQVRYADWILRQDALGAVQYLKDPISVVSQNPEFSEGMGNPGRSLGYAAAAIADLNYKKALGVLRELLTKIKNPVTQEAIKRVENQNSAPAPQDRMIWLFGKRSNAEIVLGYEPDNAFVLKSYAKNKNLGYITEADETAAEDLAAN